MLITMCHIQVHSKVLNGLGLLEWLVESKGFVEVLKSEERITNFVEKIGIVMYGRFFILVAWFETAEMVLYSSAPLQAKKTCAYHGFSQMWLTCLQPK